MSYCDCSMLEAEVSRLSSALASAERESAIRLEAGEMYRVKFLDTDDAFRRACGKLQTAEAKLREARALALEEAAQIVERVSTWTGESTYCENCKNGTIYPDGEDIAEDIRALKDKE